MDTELTAVQRIANITGYKTEEIDVIKSVVAKNTNDIELMFFLKVAKTAGLNPFMKEVWCYKDNKNNLIVLTGRDGFLKKAQESRLWNGMSSSEVCENDVFEMDIPSATVTHKPTFKDRGNIIGAYAIVKPKDCELPTVTWADFKTYDKGQFVWKQFPAKMIIKVAEADALKKAFGITGLNSEYDFTDNNNGVVQAITEESTVVSEIDILKGKITAALDIYQGEDKDEIQQMCVDKSKAGEFTEKFAKEVLKTLGVSE